MVSWFSLHKKNIKSLKTGFILWLVGDKVVNIRGTEAEKHGGNHFFCWWWKSQLCISHHMQMGSSCRSFCTYLRHNQCTVAVLFTTKGTTAGSPGLAPLCPMQDSSSGIDMLLWSQQGICTHQDPVWAGAPCVWEAFGTAVAWNDMVRKEKLLWHQISAFTYYPV